METIRAFIAIPLPEPLLEQLGRLQGKLEQAVPPRSVRWVRPAGIHLTLKFLGDTPANKLPDIQAALAAVARNASPCPFAVAGLGCFPNPSRPRVVWVGIQEPGGRLTLLQETIEEAIAPLGFPPEGRGFSPHLTLGRIQRHASRSDVASVGQVVSQTTVGELGQVPSTHLHLIRSTLKPTGAEYTTLAAFSL